jgi:glycerol-3-phosphate O-acyltransferase
VTWAIVVPAVTVILICVFAWFLTSRVVRHIRRRMRRASNRALKRFRVKLNRWKLSPKGEIRHQLMRDQQVIDAIVEHSKETGEKLGEAEQRAELYVDEIVPAFQVFSYYVFGYFISRLFLNLLFKIDVQETPDSLDDKFHQENVVIYVANHRSNADYVLLTYALTRRVAISYAVGEWARVWPLESLFKSFGSYFIRRGYREKLYHSVLRRYVQLVTKQGVTQGVFIEGGLSRDGYLRPAKVGMLDYLTQVLNEEGFDKKDVVFVPVGLNYDRVLEDRPLTNEFLKKRELTRGMTRTMSRDALTASLAAPVEVAESPRPPTDPAFKKKTAKKGMAVRWSRRWHMLRRTSGLLFANLHKYWSHRLRKHGVAAVRYGAPVSFRKWCEAQDADILEMDRKDRLAEVARFGEHLLGKIAGVVPATVVAVFCRALVACGLEGDIDEQDLREEILTQLVQIEEQHGPRAPEDLDREKVLHRGRVLLAMRHIIEDRDEILRVPEKSKILVHYYARSLERYFEKSGEP